MWDAWHRERRTLSAGSAHWLRGSQALPGQLRLPTCSPDSWISCMPGTLRPHHLLALASSGVVNGQPLRDTNIFCIRNKQQQVFHKQKRSKPTGVLGSQKRTLLLFWYVHSTKYRSGYMKLPRRTPWSSRRTTPRSERGYNEAKAGSPAGPQAGRAAGAICSPGVWEKMRAYALVHLTRPGLAYWSNC